VVPAGELTTELDLERVAADVVHQDPHVTALRFSAAMTADEK
jgi:hypothetical protein